MDKFIAYASQFGLSNNIVDWIEGLYEKVETEEERREKRGAELRRLMSRYKELILWEEKKLQRGVIERGYRKGQPYAKSTLYQMQVRVNGTKKRLKRLIDELVELD